MKTQNIPDRTRSAFLPQAKSASKLELSIFILIMLILAGAAFFVFTL